MVPQHFARLLIRFCFVLGGTLCAQETWQPVGSSTTHNLWSVARGPALFVAAGENGTILTSNDGSAWTARGGGTARWLVGVAHGNGLFVVVGDNGTILTSPDAVSWTARTSGTTARLNGIAFGGGRWLAVAESGEVLSSADAFTWTKLAPSNDRLRGLAHAYGQFVITGDNGLIRTTIDTVDYEPRALPEGLFVESIVHARRTFLAVGEEGYAVTSRDAFTWSRVATGTSSYLRGVTFFNGAFIAVGDNGTILTTGDPAAGWTRRSSGTTALLTATAASDTAAIAVGFAGTIVRSAPLPSAPTIVVAPRSISDTTGSNVLLEIAAAGAPPLSYEWYFNGERIAGESSDHLLITHLQRASTGTYTVTVRNALGSIPSAPVTVSIVDPSLVGPVVDSSFNAPLVARTINAVAEQPDGKLIVAGTELTWPGAITPFPLIRIERDGAIDPTFTPPFTSGATVQTLALQPDGLILVGGDFLTVQGGRNLARLRPDGALDPSFAPVATVTTRPVREISLQADGRILLRANDRLHRLNADGSTDSTFLGPPATLSITLHALLPDGGILVAARDPQLLQPSAIRRVIADGSLDSTFNAFYAPGISTDVGDFNFLHVLPNGSALASSRFSRRGFTSHSLVRLASTGARDPNFPGLSAAPEPFAGVTTTYAISAAGKILQAYNVSPPSSSTASPRRSVRRFNADGTRDFSFDERTGANGNITGLYPLRDGRLLVAGDFTHFDGINRPHLVRLVAANGVELQAPALVSLAPEAIAVRPGEPVTVTAIFAGTAPLAHSASLGSVAVENGVATVRIQTDISGTYLLTLTASNGVGTTRSLPIRIAVAPSVPILRMQPPATLFVRPGRDITLAVEAIGSAPFTYEWYRNGVLVGTTASLVLSNASAVDAGDYTVVVRNLIGATTSQTTRLTLDAGPRLTNLSTRATVAAGEQVLITGFVISGSAKKDLLIRGVGPALAPFGVTGTLPNPIISLHDAAGRILATNDDWSTNFTPPSLFTTLGAFSFGASPTDSALRVALDPGAYTLHVNDTAGRSGIALAEIYEADGLPTRLANLSARTFVGVGASIAISGFVVQGQQPGRFLIRAVGPTLADFGVTNPLADPIINVTTPTGLVLASNDNWSTDAAGVIGAGAQVAAFPLRPASRDAALVMTLPAGNYTAHVSGLNGTSGIALVEIYELPE